MNITINLDLEAAIEKAVSMERLAPLIDKALTEALASAIASATGYRSEFREAVEKQLAQALPHGLEIGEIAKFQQVVNQVITDSAQRTNETTIATALAKVAKLTLTEVPTKVKLSEILKLYRDSLHIGNGEAFFALYEPGEYGFGHLFLSDENHSKREYDKYSAKVRIGFAHNDGSVYSLALDGKYITPASTPNICGRFEDVALAMYVGRTSLVVDLDADGVEEAAAGNQD